MINPLTPELNPSAQCCLPRFLLGILIFKGLTARRLYKSFGVKGLHVTFLKTSVIVKIVLKYTIKLFCSFCNSLVQTSTFLLSSNEVSSEIRRPGFCVPSVNVHALV
jgi:hypothetical protein